MLLTYTYMIQLCGPIWPIQKEESSVVKLHIFYKQPGKWIN